MTNISKVKADWTMEGHCLLTMKHTNEEPGPEQLQMTALYAVALTYQAILLWVVTSQYMHQIYAVAATVIYMQCAVVSVHYLC